MDGILRCWLKVSILSIGWDTDIENVVVCVSMLVKDKTLLVNDCEELCGLFAKYHASARVVVVKDGPNSMTGVVYG